MFAPCKKLQRTQDKLPLGSALLEAGFPGVIMDQKVWGGDTFVLNTPDALPGERGAAETAVGLEEGGSVCERRRLRKDFPVRSQERSVRQLPPADLNTDLLRT